MLPIVIKGEYAGFDLDININDSCIYICGDSGAGKTLLLNLLQSYFSIKGITCVLINYLSNGRPDDAVPTYRTDTDIVLCDNADLYMTPELLKELQKRHKLILVACHNNYKIKGLMTLYKVKLTGNHLSLQRAGS